MNKPKDAIGLIKIKQKYPSKKKLKLNIDINKFVKKIECVFFNNKWCKWSWPASNGFLLFFNRIILTDKNSYTNNVTDQANNIGWANFWLAAYIKMNDTIKPNNKLPLSPKKSLGSLKIEKLKNKKTQIGIIIINKNKSRFWSSIKKNRIANTVSVV